MNSSSNKNVDSSEDYLSKSTSYTKDSSADLNSFHVQSMDDYAYLNRENNKENIYLMMNNQSKLSQNLESDCSNELPRINLERSVGRKPTTSYNIKRFDLSSSLNKYKNVDYDLSNSTIKSFRLSRPMKLIQKKSKQANKPFVRQKVYSARSNDLKYLIELSKKNKRKVKTRLEKLPNRNKYKFKKCPFYILIIKLFFYLYNFLKHSLKNKSKLLTIFLIASLYLIFFNLTCLTYFDKNFQKIIVLSYF
jgi:hypothetical protein